MNQALALSLGGLLSLIGHGRHARNLLLRCIPSLAHGHRIVSQNGDPLGRFNRFTVGGREQRSFLPGHPLPLGSTGPHNYGSRLLLKLSHLDHILS
jgi:hypothetical protein